MCHTTCVAHTFKQTGILIVPMHTSEIMGSIPAHNTNRQTSCDEDKANITNKSVIDLKEC